MTYTTLSFYKNGYRNFLTLLLGCLLVFGSYSAQAALELEWAKHAGSNIFEEGRGIAVDGSGNTYVTGHYGGEPGFGDPSTIFGPGEAGETALTIGVDRSRMFVAKYTPSGNLVWAKRTDGGNTVSGNDLAVDSSGNSYITGSIFQIFGETTTFGSGEANETTFSNDIEIPETDELDGAFNDMFVAKYASDGSLVWAKRAGGTNPDAPIIAVGINGAGIAVDGLGNTYVTGRFSTTAIFGPGETSETTLTSNGENDIFVAKYAADGNLIWAKRAGGTSSDRGNSVTVDDSGNAYVTGSFNGSVTFGSGEAGENALTSDNDSTDTFVAKYSANGDVVWVKRAGGTEFDTGNGIAVDDSGSAYITGKFKESATFGLGEAGETTLTSNGENDVFVAKYTAGGDLVWAKSVGGTNVDQGADIAVDGSGNAYVTGSFQGTATFGAGEAVETTLTSDGSSDIFVAKYTADGDLISTKRAGGAGGEVSSQDPESGNSIAVDDSRNAYVTGVFSLTAIFGPGETNQTLITSLDHSNILGNGDIFVAKFSDATSDNPPVILDTRVTASSDDAEENTTTGKVNRGSSDLELVDQGRNNQLVGIRFNDLNIPPGATITNASIQFQTDETHSGITTLQIQGEATDNALTFTNARANISSRDKTSAAVDWEPVPWTTVGEAGPDQQTPDIASVIQEIVNRSEWSSGNSLAIIISGTGTRTAESFNGDAAGSPVLHVEYTQGSETNQPPTVDVGSDQTITLPDGAATVDVNLDGTVNDDRQPNPVTTLWSMQSGPGTVSFADSSAVDTTASFDLTGTYVLRLTADDGSLSSFDELTVTVNSAATTTIQDVRVSASSDDAEENTTTGRVNRGSSDLELVNQGRTNQLVGMRFNDLNIPQGATITNAEIQFQTDETHSGATTLLIQAEAADNASTFTNASRNISSRDRTNAAVDWEPVPWTIKGEAGLDQQTPDIASVIQEIVNRTGWSSGNSLAIIISGTGTRTAESYNGDAAGAPLLHVEYTIATGTNQPPTVDAGSDQTIVLPSSVTLDGTVNDDGLPSSSLAITWSKASGPGTVNFADSNAVDTLLPSTLPELMCSS